MNRGLFRVVADTLASSAPGPAPALAPRASPGRTSQMSTWLQSRWREDPPAVQALRSSAGRLGPWLCQALTLAGHSRPGRHHLQPRTAQYPMVIYNACTKIYGSLLCRRAEMAAWEPPISRQGFGERPI